MKSLKKYKCLIIGLGNIAFKYDLNTKNKEVISHANAIKKNKSLILCGGVDILKKNRDLFKKNYKVETFKYLDYALTKTMPDIIIISVPTEHHLKIIKKITYKKFIKIIICEKPFGYNFKQSKEVLNLVNSRTRILKNVYL